MRLLVKARSSSFGNDVDIGSVSPNRIGRFIILFYGGSPDDQFFYSRLSKRQPGCVDKGSTGVSSELQLQAFSTALVHLFIHAFSSNFPAFPCFVLFRIFCFCLCPQRMESLLGGSGISISIIPYCSRRNVPLINLAFIILYLLILFFSV